VRLIDTFVKGNLSASTAAAALGGSVTLHYYPSSETTWETSTFTGF
jgi:hypothetical protein